MKENSREITSTPYHTMVSMCFLRSHFSFFWIFIARSKALHFDRCAILPKRMNIIMGLFYLSSQGYIYPPKTTLPEQPQYNHSSVRRRIDIKDFSPGFNQNLFFFPRSFLPITLMILACKSCTCRSMILFISSTKLFRGILTLPWQLLFCGWISIRGFSRQNRRGWIFSSSVFLSAVSSHVCLQIVHISFCLYSFDKTMELC